MSATPNVPAGGPELSVVISTYNRGALLVDAIQSVLDQVGAPPFEVVVVDNNSTDDTRALVEHLAGTDGRLRYVFEPRQGVSYGRNAGVQASTGAIIAFTDDDVRAEPTWLAAIARAFEDHPWAAFAGGKVLPRWPGPVPSWLTREHWSPLALVDYGDDPVRVDFTRPIALLTCNAAFRRAMFEQVGGFDPQYQHRPGAVSACEDHELELRVLRAGGAGVYVPDAVIEAEIQPKRLTRAYHRKWSFDHGRALVALLGPNETFDARMVPVPRPPGKRTLFGAEPWAYRAVVTSAVKSVGAWLAGRRDAAFRHEANAREALGHIVGAATRRRPA